MERAAVERFVRGELGCSCPDEVFQDLRVEESDGLHDGAIHVGGRLLVLLLEGTAVETRLPALLEAGRARRDGAGYNRVRFVVLTDDAATGRLAQGLFDASRARDERTHLHLLLPAAVRFR